MNLLKSGLNKEFYKWVDDVKKAYRHKRELEDKLEYFESRLTGYQAVVYDSIGSGSSRNIVEENLLYVIGKIDQVKYKIDESNQKIEEYHNLLKNLCNQEKILLKYLIETNMNNNEIASSMMISRSRVYQISFMIIRYYDKQNVIK